MCRLVKVSTCINSWSILYDQPICTNGVQSDPYLLTTGFHELHLPLILGSKCVLVQLDLLGQRSRGEKSTAQTDRPSLSYPGICSSDSRTWYPGITRIGCFARTEEIVT
jgi:hypothetical protein